MLYESPADFCAEYARAHSSDTTDELGTSSELNTVTVVDETPDTARVEALWYTSGHDPDSGYWDVFERFAFVLVKRDDGWHLQSRNDLGYE